MHGIQAPIHEGTGIAEFNLDSTVHSPPLDQKTANFHIIYTDRNLALIYFCNDLGFFHTKHAWVLSRGRRVEEDEAERIYALFETIAHVKISDSIFHDFDKLECPDVHFL